MGKEKKLKEQETSEELLFLAGASKILSSSLDYEKTLANVARLAVPRFADWCSVVIKKDNKLKQLAVAHVDPKKVKWAIELNKKNPPDINGKTGIPQIIRSRKSEIYPEITDALLVASAKTPAELKLLRKLHLTSVMTIPLLVKREAIGAISFVSTDDNRHYAKKDLTLAEEIASRMALAIENARLYSEAQAVAETQRRLAAIVQSSDDAIISKTRKGIITTWNKGAQLLYGYTPEEIIGKSVSVLMPSDKKDDFPKIMNTLLKGKSIDRYETTRLTKDGRIIDVSITVSPIKDDNGKIIGASKVARDITYRRGVEERQRFLEQASKILGASINYYDTLKSIGKIIVPYLADYCRIVVLNDEGRIEEITVNHVDSKKLPLVKKLYDSYKNDPNATNGVGKILKTGRPERLDKINPDMYKFSPSIAKIVKELNLTSYMGIPMKAGNRIVGAITFSSTRSDKIYTKDDILLAEELANRAALAIDNARLYANSQKAILLRDEFISVASHELKTPITTLKMYTQVLQKQFEGSHDTSLSRPLTKMDEQVNKLTILVGDLLNVSKVQHGQLQLSKEEINLDEIVKDVIESVQLSTKRHSIILEGKINRKTIGDRYRIYQVITNLLTNAVKYSPKSNKVIVELTAERDFAVVTVKDFGIGIDTDQQKKIFSQFYRVSDPNERTFPGLGMGLYISNEIVKRHGGTLNVTSKKGLGSQFSFTLPYDGSKIKTS